MSSVSVISVLILPMAVFSPVPMTTPLALPAATLVPEKTRLSLSWLTALGSLTGSVCLMTVTDSPVRMDWSILSVVDMMEMSLMSAGALSPTAISTMSPGTSWLARMFCTPFLSARMTLPISGSYSFRASIASSALRSYGEKIKNF